MKLYHARYILPALGVFLLVVTFPVWRGMASRDAGFKSPPNPKGERCIEPKSFMRAEHMRMLGRWRDEGAPHTIFLIGGADGLSPELRRRAKLAIAFGSATWPHQMVRVMLLEQLYRAATILAGHPYHRA